MLGMRDRRPFLGQCLFLELRVTPENPYRANKEQSGDTKHDTIVLCKTKP
jgi:hypothetical protein